MKLDVGLVKKVQALQRIEDVSLTGSYSNTTPSSSGRRWVLACEMVQSYLELPLGCLYRRKTQSYRPDEWFHSR